MRYPDVRPVYALLKREPAAPDLGDQFVLLLHKYAPTKRQLRQLTLYLISAQSRPGLARPLLQLIPYYFLMTPKWTLVPGPILEYIISRCPPGHERDWMISCLPLDSPTLYDDAAWISRYISVSANRDCDVTALLALGARHAWPNSSWCSIFIRALQHLEYDDNNVLHSTWITDEQMRALVSAVTESKIHLRIMAGHWNPQNMLPTHVEFCSRFFSVFPFFRRLCVDWQFIWDHADDILSWRVVTVVWERKPAIIRHKYDPSIATFVHSMQMTLIQHRILAVVACLGDELIHTRGATPPARFFRILQQLPPEMVGEILYQLFGDNHAGPVHDTAIAWALSM